LVLREALEIEVAHWLFPRLQAEGREEEEEKKKK